MTKFKRLVAVEHNGIDSLLGIPRTLGPERILRNSKINLLMINYLKKELHDDPKTVTQELITPLDRSYRADE